MHLPKDKVKQLIKMMNSMSNSSIPAQKPIIEMFELAMDEKMLDYLLALGVHEYNVDGLKEVYISLYGEEGWEEHYEELKLMSFIHPKSNEERDSYELSPIFPGWVEFYTSGPANEKRKAILEKFMEFWGILKKLNHFPMRQFNDSRSIKKQKEGKPPRFSINVSTGSKEVVLEKPLTSMQEVYTKGDVYKLLEKNRNEIAVGNCFCRSHKMYSKNEECENEIPLQSCMVLGAIANQLVNNGVAKPLSFEEAVELLEEFEKKGCIHTAYHYKNNADYEEIVICNCCKDCCLMYSGVLEGGLSKLYARSFYIPEMLDENKCVGCNLCGKYCPTEATYYDKNKKELIFDASNCIGCGQCVNQCKFEVRKMVPYQRDVFVKTKKKGIK